jgi:hypothetical protein
VFVVESRMGCECRWGWVGMVYLGTPDWHSEKGMSKQVSF